MGEDGGQVFKGFRDFIMRRSVVDLAIGVVIGAAFGTVVTPFVKDLLKPLIGTIGKTPDFSFLVVEVKGSKFLIGDFLNALISVLLIGCRVFLCRATGQRADGAYPPWRSTASRQEEVSGVPHGCAYRRTQVRILHFTSTRCE